MPNFWHLAHQTLEYEPHEVFHILNFFCNMLQCNLKFKSAPFTNLIIYIIFLFMMGPLSFLLTFFFLPFVTSFPCPTNFYSFSHFLVQQFLCSLSLYFTSLPPSSTKPKPEHQARAISMIVVSFSSFFSFFFGGFVVI